MNTNQYEQAKQNVQKQREKELREEIQDDIKEEYERLKFESEKVIADEATLVKIKLLHQKCSKLSAILTIIKSINRFLSIPPFS